MISTSSPRSHSLPTFAQPSTAGGTQDSSLLFRSLWTKPSTDLRRMQIVVCPPLEGSGPFGGFDPLSLGGMATLSVRMVRLCDYCICICCRYQYRNHEHPYRSGPQAELSGGTTARPLDIFHKGAPSGVGVVLVAWRVRTLLVRCEPADNSREREGSARLRRVRPYALASGVLVLGEEEVQT